MRYVTSWKQHDKNFYRFVFFLFVVLPALLLFFAWVLS